MRSMITILLLTFVALSGARNVAIRKDEKTSEIPVAIKYSRSVPAPPDSIQDFIKVYMLTKAVQIIDTVTANALQDGEIRRVWMANVKKGDPAPPDFIELLKKTNTVCYFLYLSVYNNPEQTNYSVDSIRWSVYPVPFKFEAGGGGKNGAWRKGMQEKNLFLLLKEAADEIIAMGLSK